MEPLQIQPQAEFPEPRSSREGVSGRYARSRTRAASREARESSGRSETTELGRSEQAGERRSEGSRRSHRSRRLRSKARARTKAQGQEGSGAGATRAETQRTQESGTDFAARLQSKASPAAKPAEQAQLGSHTDQGVKQELATFQAPQAPVKLAQAPAQSTQGAPVARASAVGARSVLAAPINDPKGTAEAVKARAEAKAPAETAPTPERDQASDVLRQVRLQLFPEARTATVHLKPAELGRVSIKIVVDGDEVQAIVRAETPEALAALEQHMPELQASLSDRGFADAELDLALGFEGESEDHLSGARAVEPSPDHIHRLFANAEGVDFYA